MRHPIMTGGLLLSLAVIGLAQIPQQYIWKITFVADNVGKSKITVRNRCSNTHDFAISGRNVPFLGISRKRVRVKGGGSVNIGVTVDTHNLKERSYQGQVTLFCLTCRKERACSQSRDILNVTLSVLSKEKLANYKAAKDYGIDSPIFISATDSRRAASIGSGSSDAEIEKLLLSLSGSAAAGAGSSSCGLPQLRASQQTGSVLKKKMKDCKGECSKRLGTLELAETNAGKSASKAERFCLGLIQLENTTAFVEARASRSRRQLADAVAAGSDGRVLAALKREAENSGKDAEVFRSKVKHARLIVDRSRAAAFSAMEDLDDATRAFEKCTAQASGCM